MVKAMKIKWVDGFTIIVKSDKREVTISANKEGLLSLAQHLTALAEETVGSHIHYDEYNSLEERSEELTIEKLA